MAQNEFPNITPSSRSYKPGTYATATFRSMNGAETRVLYGDQMIGAEMSLTYAAISDGKAAQFIDHFVYTKGVFDVFKIVRSDDKTRGGWSADLGYLTPHANTAEPTLWRYKEAPTITNIYPGYSSVTVILVGVNKS